MAPKLAGSTKKNKKVMFQEPTQSVNATPTPNPSKNQQSDTNMLSDNDPPTTRVEQLCLAPAKKRKAPSEQSEGDDEQPQTENDEVDQRNKQADNLEKSDYSKCYPPFGSITYKVVDPLIDAVPGVRFAPFEWLPTQVRLWAQHALKMESWIKKDDNASKYLVVTILKPLPSLNGGSAQMIAEILDLWLDKGDVRANNAVKRIPVGDGDDRRFYLVTLKDKKMRKDIVKFKRMDRGVFVSTAGTRGALLLFDVVVPVETAPRMGSVLMSIEGLQRVEKPNWVKLCLDAVEAYVPNRKYEITKMKDSGSVQRPELTGTSGRIMEVEFNQSAELLDQWLSKEGPNGFCLMMMGWKCTENSVKILQNELNSTYWYLLPTCKLVV
ncbi:uncharacterized protein MELLADRAFT_90085 [Melampsora larici-populina 98AG31]|uniref:Uncharacterized protein n=1 Tax=Melampsora larici-populina (strain 98AG31 / pathotype 3-4-7) TaxID=747676 RepID=F4SED4_MELLP|nr:uncharacterized protein MELLADRAFT_90085 [Melampsora larici-populina 98AG31]EGF96992.1 hypothetical protein MELLADRAFT_90085 [Melampsora larici-populina 98AG31]